METKLNPTKIKILIKPDQTFAIGKHTFKASFHQNEGELKDIDCITRYVKTGYDALMKMYTWTATICNNETTQTNAVPSDISKEVHTLCESLKSDKDYYISWQANIAMSFYDTLIQAGYNFPELHKLSNDAAIRFLDMLIKE